MKIGELNYLATYITDLNPKVSHKMNRKNDFSWTKYYNHDLINVLGTCYNIFYFHKAIWTIITKKENSCVQNSNATTNTTRIVFSSIHPWLEETSCTIQVTCVRHIFRIMI